LKERSEKIADGFSKSVTLGVGQFCTNPGLVVALDSDETQQFLQQTATLLKQSPAGTMLTSGIKQAFTKGIQQLKSIPNVSVLTEVEVVENSGSAGAVLLQSHARVLREHPELAEEVFGPSSVSIICDSKEEVLQVAHNLKGHLTATIIGTQQDLEDYRELIDILTTKVGRLLINGYPTGVEVGYAMVHGGPYPATTDSRSTSVGTAAIKRFARPVCYQDFPDTLLPEALQNNNPYKIWRLVNGELTKNDKLS
jgi:NADP-dependent aldehyde dehydrogenase